MNARKKWLWLWVWMGLILSSCSPISPELGRESPEAISPTLEAERFPTVEGSPVLYFSDITSGPRVGNSDTSEGRTPGDGAIVTVWGVNLGNSRGSSQVVLNGVEAASYYYWGKADAPADLYAIHRIQKISFQISRLAAEGAGEIYAVVNGQRSNPLPFTIREGEIYFSKATGNDETGNGSWTRPWQTIQMAVNNLSPGDIAYIGDGVDQLTELDHGAAVNLSSSGEAGRPKALIVYPGAESNVGNENLSRAFHNWDVTAGGYTDFWVIAGFRIVTSEVGVPLRDGVRVVGNYVTAPRGDGLDGAIGGYGDDLFILGNELEHIGSPACSKLYHAIYLTGIRRDSGSRSPVESQREVAWNYIHDNLSNRAINIYSEQELSAFIQKHRIHDNAIINQRGDGILLGYYVTGENWIYNNLIVYAGLGPEWDDPSYHTGIHINTGHEQAGETIVYIYQNTLYGNGWSGALFAGETGSLLFDPESMERSTTIHFSNNIIYSVGEPYLAGESAWLPAGHYGNCWFGDGDAPTWDAARISADPVFIDPARLDFRLRDGSACLDVGEDLYPVVIFDLLGTPRPQGGGFDMGVYEAIVP